MRTTTFLFIPISALIISCSTKVTEQNQPLAQVMPVVEEYFGTKISDPYRHMEDLKDPSVQNWFKAQAEYSRRILNSIPGRQALIDKMTEFDGRKSALIRILELTDSDRYFYLKTTPDDETGKLFYRDGPKGKEILLYDPETHAKDTTERFVISSASASIDGSKVAFEVAANGTESSEILIMDVTSMKLYPERIDRCWGASPSWLQDGDGFLYSRLKSADVHRKDRELDSKTYLHLIGTDLEHDKEIFSREKYPDLDIRPEDMPWVYYDKESKLLFGYLSTVENSLKVYYAPISELSRETINWKQLFKPEDEVYNFKTTDNDLYAYTPKNAPNFRILKTSLVNPDLGTAEVIIPEDKKRTITNFGLSSKGIYYMLSENGVSAKFMVLPTGEKEVREIELPFTAGAANLRTKGSKFPDVWISLNGWTSDFQRFRYSSSNNEFLPENLSSIADYPEYDSLVVEELMVPSHDGIHVPLSLVYNKNLRKDGKNPVFFLGYGAYGAPMNPFFSPEMLLWTTKGGIFAIAHVRGGGELGDLWHKGGYKTTKPNTWKDLIACAEYLVSENYTAPKKISIYSASAGGILIGRAMTERPELFAVAIPDVGCMNALRGEESPNGPVNAPEFGTVKDSVECMALIEMDAYLHIQDGVNYPATLITAGMNDPRVIAWQPAKFAARLQAANRSKKPVLFWADFEAGHGIGNSKTKDFESLADVLSFAFWQTGHPDYQVVPTLNLSRPFKESEKAGTN